MTELMTDDLYKLSIDKNDPNDDDSQTVSIEASIQEHVQRAKVIHEEVEAYVEAVLARQKLAKTQHPVEYRNLRNDMKNELIFLRRIAGTNMDTEKARHYIVSSNLLYYEALWSAAKRSSGLQSFRKYFFWNRHTAPAGKHTIKGLSLAKGSQAKGKTAALVDIVAEAGMTWIRVSTVSEKRLLFDLAKLGWVNDSDSDDDMPDAITSNRDDDSDDDDQVDVVKNARELARAARANPIRGRPPRVHFVLTRVAIGKTPAIDNIIEKIKATGASVQCLGDIPPPQPLQEVLPRLLVDESRALSDTLNIDCTILLALISDISHQDCPVLDWYPGEVRAQIKEEGEEHLLPTHLYPAIGSHHMVCTKEAADQMNLIVQTLATDTEKMRADILLGQGEKSNLSSEVLAAEWASISRHTTPEQIQLPIQVMPVNMDTITDGLPAVAAKIAEELGYLNKSIFLYGWANRLTTLSANRGRARQIDSLINDHGLRDGEAGPHVWLCGESRSLIAKHGRRR